MLILLGVESVRNIDFITQMVYGRIIDPTFLLIFFSYQHMVKKQNDLITKIKSEKYHQQEKL